MARAVIFPAPRNRTPGPVGRAVPETPVTTVYTCNSLEALNKRFIAPKLRHESVQNRLGADQRPLAIDFQCCNSSGHKALTTGPTEGSQSRAHACRVAERGLKPIQGSKLHVRNGSRVLSRIHQRRRVSVPIPRWAAWLAAANPSQPNHRDIGAGLQRR